MENVVAQRIKSVLDINQISIAAFAKRIGMQQVTCNRQIRGDQAVSLGLIEGFLREYPNVSAEWLLRGKGSTDYQYKNDLQDESIWKAKYEAIKECYDMLVSNIGSGMGNRTTNINK